MLCLFSVSLLSLAAAPDDVLAVQAPGSVDRDCCNHDLATPEAVCQCKGRVCEDEAAEDGHHYCPRGTNETAAQCCAHKTKICINDIAASIEYSGNGWDAVGCKH